jgi:hypothetical protein
MPESVRQLSWRAAPGILAGIALALPLFLLLSHALRPHLPEVAPSGRHISPVLDTEQRTRLSTYRRACGLSSECEPPLGCVSDSRILADYCTDSQCLTDAQCPADQICQNLATAGDGPVVRFCIPVGRRREGEHCLELPGDQDSACAAGLLCGGRLRWCGRTCSPGAPITCPAGFFCANSSPEPLCLPTCEARGCPTGQECIRYEEGASTCAQVYGFDCQHSPCTDGHKCQIDHLSARPGKVWMECVERCGEGFPACTDGKVCDSWQCRPACDPQAPEACGEGFRCRKRRPEVPTACQPDW